MEHERHQGLAPRLGKEKTEDIRGLLLIPGKEATVDIVAESMEEVDTKVMKDVRV